MSIAEKVRAIWNEGLSPARIDNVENAHEYLYHDTELTGLYSFALDLLGRGFYGSTLEILLVLEKRLKEKTSETHNIVVLNLMGCAFASKKEYGVALSKFDEALAHLPKNASNHVTSFLYAQKGSMETDVGDLVSAESSLDIALKYDAKNVYAWRRMADLKAKQGKDHEAIPRYKKAIKVYNPANSIFEYFFAVLGLVRSYMETGQKEKAEDTLEKLNEPPLSHSPLSNLYRIIKPQITNMGKWG
ncbi:MAG TPA: hypothetical protein VJI46_07415 [Candidatus Nanoarchaeia archaeon]|nr:hypothetical protein [Candidatus Nanoarchaeia archaeon]